MLTELRIRDYAVIDRLTLRLGSGLNVLTGETGAGKSIIVGALSLLLGERASSEVVRTGADRAEVEGVFDVDGNAGVQDVLTRHGLEPEDGLLILRREIAAGGRGRVWVNGAASTVSLLGELGVHLVDLHGQHEHQSLLQPRQQRGVLDAYAAATDLAAAVRREYDRLRDGRTRLTELERRVRETEQRADFLRFQLAEIDNAQLVAGEEEELELEVRRLSHAGELATLADTLHSELYAGEDSVSARVAEVRRTLEQLIRIDPALQEWQEVVQNALYGLEELGREMGSYASGVEQDPGRLDAVRRRQDTIFRLKRKYGPDLADVLSTAEAARTELAALDSSSLDHCALEREISSAQQALEAAAARLSAARSDAATRLAGEVAAVLPDLGMAAARFAVELASLPAPGPSGSEDVEFRISVNAGFEPRPLARVASGGELSRVMLALKTVLARLDGVPTLIFDEVDAGIGGRVANQVGEKLARVAHQHQVFVITHLPQIASQAQHHLLVQKTERDGVTATTVEALEGDTRVRELARLLGGDPDSGVSLRHARELLGGASSVPHAAQG
jgi:DNA repair protein RecN (Recombination protein N)